MAAPNAPHRGRANVERVGEQLERFHGRGTVDRARSNVNRELAVVRAADVRLTGTGMDVDAELDQRRPPTDGGGVTGSISSFYQRFFGRWCSHRIWSLSKERRGTEY